MRKAPEAELTAPKRPGSTDQRQPKFVVCGRPTGNLLCQCFSSGQSAPDSVHGKAVSACLFLGAFLKSAPARLNPSLPCPSD